MLEIEKTKREDRVFFFSVGLWEGFLGVKIVPRCEDYTEPLCFL